MNISARTLVGSLLEEDPSALSTLEDFEIEVDERTRRMSLRQICRHFEVPLGELIGELGGDWEFIDDDDEDEDEDEDLDESDDADDELDDRMNDLDDEDETELDDAFDEFGGDDEDPTDDEA